MEIHLLTKEQAKSLLALEESQYIEKKSSQIGAAELSRTISAFANADGGEIYIGFNEDKVANTWKWDGLKKQEDANGYFQAFQDIMPLGKYIQYMFLRCERKKGLVLKIQILRTPTIIKATNDKIYERNNAQNLPIDTPDKIERLKFKKGVKSFESHVLDLSTDIITKSETINFFIQETIPYIEPEEWLRKMMLIDNDKPTVAGVLLFADTPQAILPKQSGIKITRFKTSAAEGFREVMDFQPITIEGCLYEQIKSAVSKATEVIEEMKRLGDAELVKIKYPPEAIHEIITNAVIHRDYSIKDDIHIRIFDDRIEIESPGSLPGHITVENILKTRFPRNGSINNLLNKFPDPPNKDVGEGLKTAFRAMQKLDLKAPLIREKEYSVLVIIRHEHLPSIYDTIMQYLSKNEFITNRIAREICNIDSDYKIKQAFDKLREKKLISRVQSTNKRNALWQKTLNADDTLSEIKPKLDKQIGIEFK